MKHILSIIFTVIITDFYFFPIEFVFLPGVNTKMVLAGFSLILLGFNLAKGQTGKMDKGFFWLSLAALGVSLASYISIVINNTFDYSFTGYIISMWVWLGGAYTVIETIKRVHGKCSVPLVCDYLIAVCVAQCVIAYVMSLYTPMRDFVDSILGGEAFMSKTEGRMYGIGAALDVAGLRFAAVLVMNAYMLANAKRYFGWYIIAFLIISVVGNMISRTTTMGIGIAVIYWIYAARKSNWKISGSKLWVIATCAVIFIGGVIYLYNADYSFRKNLRFGFEGFFSLAETGEWEVHSNEILTEHMIVFPKTLDTWIIGDGYCANPLDEIFRDPYYTGPNYHGYYMATDIGYIRFIFYFGLIGLVAFVSFFIVCGKVCVTKFSKYKVLFVLLLLVNFIGWCKVATDIFLVFAPFLCIGREESDAAEERTALNEVVR